MTGESDITVIVVSRDLEALLKESLRHVARAARNYTTQLVVVDNASATPYDPKSMGCPPFAVIRYDQHHGFAACCNAAAKAWPARYYLLLNNDVLLHEQALVDMMLCFEDRPTLGIVGTRMVFPSNTIQHAGVVFGADQRGPYHVNRELQTDIVPRDFRLFQAVTGACMLVRREVWEQLGGMDESYAFGLEDIDFCLRAGQQGWLCGCCRTVDSLHFESMTPGRVEMDVPSRAHFMKQWKGRYTLDG